jgi:hypothetical protein
MKRVMVSVIFCFLIFSVNSQRNIGSFDNKDDGTDDPCKNINGGIPYIVLEGSLLDTDLIDNEIHILFKDCYSGEVVAQTGNIEQYITNEEEVQCGQNSWKTLFTYRIKINFPEICEDYPNQNICVDPCIYILIDDTLIPVREFSDRAIIIGCKYIHYVGGLRGCSDSIVLCCSDYSPPEIDKSFIDTSNELPSIFSVELINNPVMDKINLKIIPNENVKNVTIMLTDISGNILINKKLDQRNFEFNQIETSFLPFGVYTLIISNGNTKIVNLILKN